MNHHRHILNVLLCFLGALSASAANDIANFSRYENDNKRLMAEPNTGTRVVFMGNSITDNWATGRPEFFELNDFIGRGISGQTTYEMLLRFRDDVINLKPAAVVIGGGTNDIAQNNDITYVENRTFGNIVSMAEIAQANNIKVLLASVLPVTSFAWNPSITNHKDKIESLNARIKEYAESHGMLYVDYYSKMVTPDRGLIGTLTTDGVHPNDAGYEIMEGILLPLVRQFVKFESPVPDALTIQGEALTDNEPIAFTKTSVKTFEVFSDLKGGKTFVIKDDKGTEYVIKGDVIEQDTGGSKVEKDAVYSILLDFVAGKAVVSEVKSVSVWNCFYNKSMADLTYTGEGKWSGTWNCDLKMPWGKENRYRIVMTMGETVQHWGPKQGGYDGQEPDGSADYYMMKRVTPANTWANTWRVPMEYDSKTLETTVTMRGSFTHSISEESSSVSEISGNSADSIIEINGNEVKSIANVEFYDLHGNLIGKSSAGDIRKFQPGVYIAVSGATTVKFIVYG